MSPKMENNVIFQCQNEFLEEFFRPCIDGFMKTEEKGVINYKKLKPLDSIIIPFSSPSQNSKNASKITLYGGQMSENSSIKNGWYMDFMKTSHISFSKLNKTSKIWSEGEKFNLVQKWRFNVREKWKVSHNNKLNSLNQWEIPLLHGLWSLILHPITNENLITPYDMVSPLLGLFMTKLFKIW